MDEIEVTAAAEDRAAYDWIEATYSSYNFDAADRDYSTDDLVDAFMAGQAHRTASSAGLVKLLSRARRQGIAPPTAKEFRFTDDHRDARREHDAFMVEIDAALAAMEPKL